MRTIHLVDPIGNTAPLNVTRRVRNLQITDSSCSFDIAMGAQEASMYIDNLAYRWIVVAHDGVVQRYRLQTPTMMGDGVRFDAISPIATLDDDEYSALWSTMSMEGWTPGRTTDSIYWMSERFDFDSNGRIQVTARKNEKFSTANAPGSAMGAYFFRTENNSSRSPVIMQTSWKFLAPANWVGQFIRGTSAYSIGNIIAPLAGSGVEQSGSFCETFPATYLAGIQLSYNNAVPTLYIGETGECYLRLVKVRIATSSANMINTTIALATAAGVRTVTPASMARIYVGQELVIDSTLTASEAVIVTAITTTTFTATFAKAHLANATVKAIVIYDDEIIKDLHTQVLALNPDGALDDSTGYIQSSGIDRLKASWSEARGTAILEELAKPVRFRFGVRDNRLVYEASNAYQRAWKVQVSDLEVVRPLDELYNSVRAGYTVEEAAVRTAYSTDEASALLNGIIRRQTVDAQTTNATVAATVSATALADTKTRPVRSGMRILRVTDFYGAPASPDAISVGDSITIVGLPAVLAANDKLRTFTVGERSIDPETGDVAIVPDKPIKGLDVLLAQLALQ